MPIVFVHLPQTHTKGLWWRRKQRCELEEFLYKKLPEAVAAVSELGLKPEKVTVFAPRDHLVAPREEIVVIITGLIDMPERTQEVVQLLAESVRDCTISALTWSSDLTELVEVLVHPLVNKKSYAGEIFPHGAERRRERSRT